MVALQWLGPYPFQHAGAWVNLGRGHLRKRAWWRAAQCLDSAIKVFLRMGEDAVPADVLVDVAWCYLAAGENDPAIRRLLAAVLAAEHRNDSDEGKADLCVMFDYFCNRTGMTQVSLSPQFRAAHHRVAHSVLEEAMERLRERAALFLNHR
jgi:hypothetical protein